MKRPASLVAIATALLLLLLAAISALLFWLQPGPYRWRDPGDARLLASLGALLFYLLLFGLLQWRRLRRAQREQAQAQAGDAVLVIHSSQTGHAEQIAVQTAQALRAAKVPAQVVALDMLDAPAWSRARRALFIASTTGEGDPPDAALRFIRHVMMEAPELRDLQYGLLALGDREYQQFCAWGRRLDGWLQQQGATPLFERIDVNNADPASLERWRSQLAVFAGGQQVGQWKEPEFRQWTLIERRQLNVGSAGAPCFHIALAPAFSGGASWQAGDVIAVQLPGDPPVLRDYSIASLPSDGSVHLLIRQTRRADGSLGIGSGWLTQHGTIGSTLPALLRSNNSFHAPDDDRPVILVGNGTGLAGLRALLKSRIAHGFHANWLLFGERNAEHDFYYRDELLAWQSAGSLKQLDLVFSRDGDRHEYVQDRLRARTLELREWVSRGAAIYVCGSAQGMATGVDEALHDALGTAGVDLLREAGRYRRDVY